MRHSNRWVVVVLIIVSLLLVACGQAPENLASSPPARVEHIGQTGLSRVTLTAEAAKRLGIETSVVSNTQVDGKSQMVVPYRAVYYDLNGVTWVYTNPEPLTFVRASIRIDHIAGDQAVLSDGPPSGTTIVTVGVPELYGTEFGVGQ